MSGTAPASSVRWIRTIRTPRSGAAAPAGGHGIGWLTGRCAGKNVPTNAASPWIGTPSYWSMVHHRSERRSTVGADGCEQADTALETKLAAQAQALGSFQEGKARQPRPIPRVTTATTRSIYTQALSSARRTLLQSGKEHCSPRPGRWLGPSSPVRAPPGIEWVIDLRGAGRASVAEHCGLFF